MQSPPDIRCDARTGEATPMRSAEIPVRRETLPAWNSHRVGVRQRALEWLRSHEDAVIVGPLFAYVRVHAAQLVRYVLVGATLAALNLAFLYGLRNWLHLSDPVAVTGMYVLGFLVHFPAHRWITYGAQLRPVRPQLLRYAVMLVWNFAVMQTVVALAARLSISPYIGVMVATGLTVISNFLAMAHIVFAKRRRR